jgi:hypothetical protein
VFAINAGQALDAGALGLYVTLWTEAFADIPDAVLEAAFKKTLTTCKFWPIKVADVCEHVDTAEDSQTEEEWQHVIEYARRYVYPDIGVRAPKPLPPDVDHAARAAGGLYYLESCPTPELQWAKKRFVEDLTRQRKSREIAAYLPESTLGQMLRAHDPRFTLLAASTMPQLARSPEEIEQIANRLRQPTERRRQEPDPAFADALKMAEGRWRESNERIFAEWRREHGI